MAQAGELRDISRSHLPDGSIARPRQRFSLRQLSLDDQTFGTTGAYIRAVTGAVVTNRPKTLNMTKMRSL